MRLLRQEVRAQRPRGRCRQLIRGTARTLAAFGAALGGLIATYLLAALIGAFLPGETADLGPAEDGAVQIHLLAGPIHYDFLLPLNAETRAALSFAAEGGVPLDHPGAEWVIVGWGAKEFYTATGSYSDLRLRAVAKAIAGDAAVLRVDLAGALPPELPLRSLMLSDAGYTALLAHLTAEVGPAPVPLDHPGHSAMDVFWDAKGPFHILRPCNQWIGEALRAAGVKLGAWTPTPYAVTASLWWFHGKG